MADDRGRDGPNWATFSGYASPNYTMVPDQLFDEHLPYLSGAELKVLLYIIRRTFGFKKDSDNISLGQMLQGIQRRDGTALDRGVGLTKKTLLQALRSLQDKNLLLAEQRQSLERGNEPTNYRLNIASPSLGGIPTPPLGEKVHQGGGNKITPSPRGKNSPKQETVLQETGKQEIDPSNFRKATTSENQLDETEATHVRYGSTYAGTTRGEQAPSVEAAANARHGGVSSVGDVLDRRTRKNASTGPTTRQKAYPEDRQRILAMIEDFAIELGDEAPLPNSVTRAYNLYRQSGIRIEAFTSLMYEARSLTKEYSGNIKKQQQPQEGRTSPWGPGKNKMAYFFSILESEVHDHGSKPEAVEG